MKRHIKHIISAGGLLFLWLGTGGSPAMAMDRWEALSMLESGNNDAAIGRAGEVSRFQIKPVVWARYCPEYPVSAHANPLAALCAAQAIMHERCQKFERQYHRPPTDFEYYVLWNAPAQIQKPGKVVAERAQRFSNLVGS